MKSKLKLHGFNNLTKTLSFNIYDICYAQTPQDQQAYVEYINKEYNAKRLTQILTEVVDFIGANILNIASQDYEPQGASVTHPDDGIATFRVDIDVSTCGVISPLKALNFLIHQFDSDIVTVDYRVRGFTRDVEGNKHFIDHEINSIQNYLSEDTRGAYQMTDVNVYQENLFHTKMLLKNFELDNYLFGDATSSLSAEQRAQVTDRVKHEMLEIFYARNMPN